ncbi:MAG: transglutaminase-like domain-containing protein, partial [Planctomycetaceae bacterium]
ALRRHVERRRAALDDRNAAAMFYLAGRTPLHLALERFDTFDGQQWTHSGQPDPHPPIRIEDDRGKPWAYCSTLGKPPLYRGLEPHAVKFINLKTNRFPSSPQLAAVHVHKVNRPDFYGWTIDSVMCMPLRKQIPQLTVAHLRSQTLNLESLRSEDFTAHYSHADQLEQQANNSTDVLTEKRLNELTKSATNADLVAHTANAWTKEVPRGWRQVEAVVNHLREDFILDRQATTDATCTDVVNRFLTERRGPDYLFATTAAILLRNLGYPTRLVTGFYARSDRFDRRAGQTTVLAEDVHVWAEVYVGDNTWVAIEPTPGYEPPAESLTIGQWARSLALGFLTWCQRHSVLLLMVFAALFISFKKRQAWLAFLGSLLCRLMGRRSTEARIRWTLRLLAWRAWLAGCPRPAERTISSWYAPLLRDRDTETRAAVEQFFLWSERLLYSRWRIDSADGPDIANACTAVTIVSRLQSMHHYLKEPPRRLPWAQKKQRSGTGKSLPQYMTPNANISRLSTPCAAR